MNDPRLERLLIHLAQRYAPRLVPPDWQKPGDYKGGLPEFAANLAGYDVLVMMGTVRPEDVAETQALVTDWVERYVRFYDTLTQALFPSLTAINAFFADQAQPPIVFLVGAATPVIIVFSTMIVPYVASRQAHPDVSEYELLGLMDFVLEELEAGDLPRADFRQLRASGVGHLRELLSARVRQRRLAEVDAGIASAFNLEDYTPALGINAADTPAYPPAPPELPEAGASPAPPPDMLPEEDRLAGRPGGESPFPGDIPIFFDPRSRGKRPPPVPDLPET